MNTEIYVAWHYYWEDSDTIYVGTDITKARDAILKHQAEQHESTNDYAIVVWINGESVHHIDFKDIDTYEPVA